jgi:hypothetical protein
MRVKNWMRWPTYNETTLIMCAVAFGCSVYVITTCSGFMRSLMMVCCASSAFEIVPTICKVLEERKGR